MPEIYATAHFTQYGQYDKAYTQRKRFVEEIDSQDGACTTETKTYWKSVNDWRTLLVTIPYEERQEIIFEYLDFHLLEDNEAETLLDAFNRLDPFIAAVSKRALIDFFENNALEHATRASVNKHQSKFGLLIAGLGGDILKHEQDMFRKTKCPSMFWKETRLELMEEECEKFGHSSRCKTYIKDGECSWLDRETKKSLKIGMQRKNWFADNKRMENLKLKATGYYIEELKKDPKFNFDFLVQELGKVNFSHPDTFLLPENQKRWKFTKEEIRFVEEFYDIYDVSISDCGNIITTSMRKHQEVS